MAYALECVAALMESKIMRKTKQIVDRKERKGDRLHSGRPIEVNMDFLSTFHLKKWVNENATYSIRRSGPTSFWFIRKISW